LKFRTCLAVLALAIAGVGAAAAESITVASTTSTEQSGLFGWLLPQYTKATGVDVKVVAVGTGQAIDIARCGAGP
jgi:tungstate transport system substrate-binding protein